MKIATDNDGVMADFVRPFLRYHNAKYKTNLEYKGVFSHDFWKVLRCTPQESEDRMDEFAASPSFNDILPIEGVIEAMNFLTSQREVQVITSRPLYYKPKTLQFFAQYFPKFAAVRFSEEFQNNPEFPDRSRKAQFCEQFRPEILFEDHAKNARDCSQYCKRIILFNRPWNLREYTPGNCIRVSSWKEALDILN